MHPEQNSTRLPFLNYCVFFNQLILRQILKRIATTTFKHCFPAIDKTTEHFPKTAARGHPCARIKLKENHTQRL
jgi:hypothetical protein